jgi:hypothetical protein
MTLTVSVIPASSNAGREAIRHLLKDNVTVRGIYRNTTKAPHAFTQSPLFTAVPGNVQDPTSLDFDGADVVFYVPPPVYDGTDLGEFATHAAKNIKSALQKASVRRLVLLSAPGAQHSSGIVGSCPATLPQHFSTKNVKLTHLSGNPEDQPHLGGDPQAKRPRNLHHAAILLLRRLGEPDPHAQARPTNDHFSLLPSRLQSAHGQRYGSWSARRALRDGASARHLAPYLQALRAPGVLIT